MDEEFKKKLAKALGISEEERAVLDTGGDHPYSCRCETCADYWRQMGPDPDGTTMVPQRPYGPFTITEIENDSTNGQSCKRMRESIETEE